MVVVLVVVVVVASFVVLVTAMEDVVVLATEVGKAVVAEIVGTRIVVPDATENAMGVEVGVDLRLAKLDVLLAPHEICFAKKAEAPGFDHPA